MPNPKRQHSRQRQRKRRTHWKATVASFGKCAQCAKATLSHRICPHCGFYKGKSVVAIKTKKEKKDKK